MPTEEGMCEKLHKVCAKRFTLPKQDGGIEPAPERPVVDRRDLRAILHCRTQSHRGTSQSMEARRVKEGEQEPRATRIAIRSSRHR